VTASSNALDVKPEVFALKSPCAIAASLKRSADRHTTGKNLSAAREQILHAAKPEMRRLYAR
jgi:hypothetical protein